eukprot:c23485_g1_i1 orf=278-769(+)
MAACIRSLLCHLGFFQDDDIEEHGVDCGLPRGIHGIHQGFQQGIQMASAGFQHGIQKASAGFRVTVAVPAPQKKPIVSECTPGAGGVQGLRWYTEKLQMDEDGDVALEFWDEIEVEPPTHGSENSIKIPTFEVRQQTMPAKLNGPIHTLDGNVHQSVIHYTNR